MATSRETARDALVTLLTAALVGAGLPVKTVAGSKQTTLRGITPLVTVLSAGSSREALTFQGNQAVFRYSVQVWVLQKEEGSWTLAQAEDALDDIERRIAEVYSDNRTTGNWNMLEMAGETTVSEVSVEGKAHYVEVIPTRVTLARA